MIKEVKRVNVIEKNQSPSLEDVFESINIAKQNDCIVDLCWRMHGYWYDVLIEGNDDAKDVISHMPKVYGL